MSTGDFACARFEYVVHLESGRKVAVMSEAQFQISHKSSFIFKHEELYRTNDLFKVMVDNTVYFTASEKEESIIAVDSEYGYITQRFYGTD